MTIEEKLKHISFVAGTELAVSLKDVLELLQQQVSVEPEVKVQIAEMVERHIIAHEQMKEQYLGKNLEMYSKAGGAILALEKLLKDLRKSNLSA